MAARAPTSSPPAPPSPDRRRGGVTGAPPRPFLTPPPPKIGGGVLSRGVGGDQAKRPAAAAAFQKGGLAAVLGVGGLVLAHGGLPRGRVVEPLGRLDADQAVPELVIDAVFGHVPVLRRGQHVAGGGELAPLGI